MRSRPFAIIGLILVVMLALSGVAAFTPKDAASPAQAVSESVVAHPLPPTATARVSASIVAAALVDLEAAPLAARRTALLTPGRRPWDADGLGPPAPTSAAAPLPLNSATTTTAAPSTTTTTTTTTTAAPTTTTSTTLDTTSTTTVGDSTTTTTLATEEPPPSQGGPRDPEEWRSLVAVYFPAERIDEAIRVIGCESNGDPLAVNNRSSASGLFQFLPSTWRWASEAAGWAGTNVFDPEANVAVAAWLVEYSATGGHSAGAWGHWVCKP